MKPSQILAKLKEEQQKQLYSLNGAIIAFNENMEPAKLWNDIATGWQIKLVAASCFTYLFGEYNAGMGALFCLVVLDFFTKICAISKEVGSFGKAWKTDVICSKGMRKSLYKGLWYMSLMIMSHQMEQFTFFGMNIGDAPVELTCAYLGLIECKSVLENLRDTGMQGLEPFIGLLGEKQKRIIGNKD